MRDTESIPIHAAAPQSRETTKRSGGGTAAKAGRSAHAHKGLRMTLRILVLFGPVVLAAAVLALAIVWSVAYFGMRPLLLTELGAPFPEASAFAPGRGAVYASLPDGTEGTGLHGLTVEFAGKQRAVLLWVRDTTPPAATGLERTISTLETLRPDELVRDITDHGVVKVSFLRTPPFGTVGDWDVPILLEDGSGNRAEASAMLHIRVVNEDVAIEAGSKALAPSAFLYGPYRIEEQTEITEQMLHTPGTYPIGFTIDGVRYESRLTVTDTVAPEAVTKTVIKKPGESVTPEDFLESVTDETAVTATFLTVPDDTLRTIQSIAIRLTDLGGNTTDVSAEILFSHAQPTVIEARNTPLAIEECVDVSAYEEAVFQKAFVPNRVGVFAVALLLDGAPELALVEVRDTVPPVIEAKDTVWYTNHPVDPATFCTRLDDVTKTTVETAEAIDWTKEGAQRITLIAVDEGGNTARTAITLTLQRDTEPPVLYGVTDRICYVGEPVAYLSEVFAFDALDGKTEVRVDAQKVNSGKAGKYPVTYTATDADGNSTTASCTFRFVRATVTDEEVAALAEQVMQKIATKDMTRTETLEAIFNYVRGHVRFVNSSDKTDWRKEAVRGIRNGTGDCFTFYAVTRALLDQTDIDYMSLTRKGGSTRHYWVIVNVGTGWYHLDPTIASDHRHRCFMWTNAQCKIKAYFWRYEESLYPPIATEPFQKDKVIEMERAGLL